MIRRRAQREAQSKEGARSSPAAVVCLRQGNGPSGAVRGPPTRASETKAKATLARCAVLGNVVKDLVEDVAEPAALQ